MADVALSNVKKTYGKVEVVHGIHLEVKDGEFVVFVGPSGRGTGTETMVNLDLHGHTVMAVFRERIDTIPGQTLPVLISADRVHLFDTSSGQRIN